MFLFTVYQSMFLEMDCRHESLVADSTLILFLSSAPTLLVSARCGERFIAGSSVDLTVDPETGFRIKSFVAYRAFKGFLYAVCGTMHISSVVELKVL